MEIPLLKAVCRPILDDNRRVVGQQYLYSQQTVTQVKECALTRAYKSAIDNHIITGKELFQVAFVDEDGNHVTTTDKNRNALSGFLRHHQELHLFAVSQHMAEVGKVYMATTPARETLSNLFGEDFAESMDTHLWLKLAQIACQPGRLLGGEDTPGVFTEPVKPYSFNTLIDEKRPEEDGTIWVNPTKWEELLEAYSTNSHKLPRHVTLLKVNSCTSGLVIKGVFAKAMPQTWNQIINRSGRDDFDILLCGNAIKYNTSFQVGEVYILDQSNFAYHSDSQITRGYRVNVSKQVITRSGADANFFIEKTAGAALKRVAGLMKFDEDDVLAAIGGLTKEGDENILENSAAIKKRIIQHGLPANHPTNVLQVWRLAMTVIRERLNRIDVEGFHGMGAPSPEAPGIVGVPHIVYKRWMRNHGTNEVYLFRMPYLGGYCGKFAKITPMATDTILVNWEDAAQMEGDFDGDQYFIIPGGIMASPEAWEKPDRPGKTAKEVVDLNQRNLTDAIIQLATNKIGIGPRDYQLCVAFDRYCEAKAQGNEAKTAEWKEKIQRLQVWVQQAVEGLKHGTERMLTEDEVRAMFGDDAAPHPYTRMFTNRAWREFSLQSTRKVPGYIDTVKAIVKEESSWHPLHGIFSELAKLEFGEVADIMPYWDAIKNQKTSSVANVSEVYREIRNIQELYSKGIALWNGGKNKNVSFGKDVLGPVRVAWTKLIDLRTSSIIVDNNGQEIGIQDPAKLRDLHLMLAKVAYEPQPNWLMHGRPHSLFNKIKAKKKTEEIKPVNKGKRLQSQILSEHKPLLDGIVKFGRKSGRSISVRMWLPRPGALFHHLAEDYLAREILDKALPKISTIDLINSLLSVIRTA